MILTCPFCSAKVRSGEQDCPVCKQRMTRRCSSCSETVAANAAACKYCGEDFKRAATAAVPTPGIEFIEDVKPAKRKKCCGGKILALLFLAGMVTAAFAVRADCVACAARPEHEACITTKTSVSHCGRRICRDGKTPLWATVFEKLGGRIKPCKKHQKEAATDACCPAQDPKKI